MNPRRALRLLAVVLLGAGATLFVAGAPAAAGEPDAAGWWSRLATTDPLRESPQAFPFPRPTSPDTVPGYYGASGDQLLVEGGADGAVAIAALRWTLAEGESASALTLPVGGGSTIRDESFLLACRAGSDWEPPEPRPGRWDVKPAVASGACVQATIADGLVTFDLSPLAYGRDLDIVLVPGRTTGSGGSVFRFVFDDPVP